MLYVARKWSLGHVQLLFDSVRRWYCWLLDNEPTVIASASNRTFILLAKCCRVHRATLSAAGVDWVLLDHLVEHPIIISLDDGPVASWTSTAGLVNQASDTWVVLWRDNHLLLHAMSHRLVTLIANARSILNGARSYCTDATLCIDIAVQELKRCWKMQVRRILDILWWQGLSMHWHTVIPLILLWISSMVLDL